MISLDTGLLACCVRWDIVGKFSSGGVTTVTLSCPAHHVRRRSFQLATPCNSKYLSSAINSLQLRRGSRVTSPVSHSTSNKRELFLNEWFNIESTRHSLSGSSPKS